MEYKGAKVIESFDWFLFSNSKVLILTRDMREVQRISRDKSVMKCNILCTNTQSAYKRSYRLDLDGRVFDKAQCDDDLVGYVYLKDIKQ